MALNVILMGMPGSGKTSVGQRLSKRLSAKFVDTDHLVVENAGMSITQIFADYGESEFRRLEKEAIAGLAQTTNSVIATGGGAIADSENFSLLSSLGKTVALHASPKTLFKRIKDQTDRPLFRGESQKRDQLEAIQDLLKIREVYYHKADYQIDTDRFTVDEIVDQIVGMIKN